MATHIGPNKLRRILVLHTHKDFPGIEPLWAREKWADSVEVAKLPSGVWMLREAVKGLGLPLETVDLVLRS